MPTPAEANLSWLHSQQDTPPNVIASFDMPYDAAYRGPVAGTLTGATDPTLYNVQVYSHTDADYLQGTFPVQADGHWSSGSATIFPGTKVLHVVLAATGAAIVTGRARGLIKSFVVPPADPAFGALNDRCFIYDASLAAIAYVQAGDFARARDLFTALASLQAPDGSLPFSANVTSNTVADPTQRTGAISWVGTAVTFYEQVSKDTSYRLLATRIADYLLTLQDAAGSLTGGGTASFHSTEHNVDAFFFLHNLAQLTKDPRYGTAADRIHDSLLANHFNAAEGRFNQGIGDTAKALDCYSWAGMFLLAVGEVDLAAQVLAAMEEFRVVDQGVSGYKPYGTGYLNPPQITWAEGSWGAVLFRQRMMADTTAVQASLALMQAGDGSVFQVTTARPEQPYEFQHWPAVAGTAWSAIVQSGGRGVFDFLTQDARYPRRSTMTTPADPNIPGSADPNKADTLQGNQDQGEHRGTPGQQTAPYPQAPGTLRADDPADSVADTDGNRGGEGGHSGTYVPTSQTERQTPAGTSPDTDVELGGGKGQGLSPQANEITERPATTADPDNPARSSGRNLPKDSEGGVPSTVSTDGSGR